jgi:hypothetical protein
MCRERSAAAGQQTIETCEDGSASALYGIDRVEEGVVVVDQGNSRYNQESLDLDGGRNV